MNKSKKKIKISEWIARSWWNYAEKIGYNDLPGGKLTLEYLLKYPQQVAEMLEKLAVRWDRDNIIN